MTSIRRGEVSSLWRALATNEGGVQRVFDSAHEGMTIEEMNAMFRSEARRRGVTSEVTGTAFVVGEGGAGPKLRTTKRLADGDLWGMDFQVGVNGFYSDIGRYAVFGAVDGELAKRHHAVLVLQTQVAEAIMPYETLERAFDLCPKSLAIEVHRVGREVHEAPMFSTVKDHNDLSVTVPLGAVLCVEIWAGRDGGIEDEFLVTEDGLRRLTSLPRELVGAPRRR